MPLGSNIGFMGNGAMGTKVGQAGAFGQKGNPLGRVSDIVGGFLTDNPMMVAQGVTSGTPAGKALGLYNQGSSLASNFSGSTPKSNFGSSAGQMPDYSNNALGGSDFSDQFGAMGRKMQLINGGR